MTLAPSRLLRPRFEVHVYHVSFVQACGPERKPMRIERHRFRWLARLSQALWNSCPPMLGVTYAELRPVLRIINTP